MPAWSEDLARQFPDSEHLRSEKAYKEWFLRLCGIWGDPVAAKKKLAAANTRGEKLPDGGYGYRQAFRNSPPLRDLLLLHRLFLHSWGDAPVMLDPTAGGGSIPYESVRYGIEARSNDLNPVAALVMRAGLWFLVSYGPDLIFQVRTWGQNLTERLRERLVPFFTLPTHDERVVAYIFARTVACPRTGKPVPLSPNWWLARGKKPAAVRLITQRDGRDLEEVEFEEEK